MDSLKDVLVVAVVFFSFVYFVKILSDNRIKHKIIEKGLIDENLNYLFQRKFEDNFSSALKWGMVLIGLGLAFMIGQLVSSDISDEITVGGMFLFAGIGLVIYYFIIKRKISISADKSLKK